MPARPASRPKPRGVNKDRALPVIQARRGLNTADHATCELVDPDKPLTDMQRAFVKFWAQGESIPSASARAGYNDSAAYAYRLVKMPNVLKLYHEEKRLYEEASQMTRKKVMDGLLEGIEMAKLMAEPASVINGWKTVGQMCGYFEPVKKKVEITVKGQIAMQKMELLTDEQLLAMLTNDLAEEEARDELED